MATRRLSVLAGVLALGAVLYGVSTGEDPPASERFAARIRTCKEAATNIRAEMGTLIENAGQIPAYTRGDVAAITKHMEDVAGAYTNAAAAFEKGDEEGAAALVRKAEELTGRRDRWAVRLGSRMRQAQIGEYLPANKETFDMLVSLRRGQNAREIEEFIEAKKLRSEAYGRLADATTPSADERTMQEFEDEVFDAETDVQVANMRMTWSNEDVAMRTWTTTDAAVSSPALTEARERLAAWRSTYESLYRKSRAAEQAIEQHKRKNTGMSDAIVKAYRAAKAEKDRVERELEQSKLEQRKKEGQ